MKKAIAVLTTIGALGVASSAQAVTYEQCPHIRGEDVYLVTAASPGCGFAHAAYRPILDFARTGRSYGAVVVRYRGRTYTLTCVPYAYGEGLRWSHNGVPWIDLEEDSAES
jgi:hypothetical protein